MLAGIHRLGSAGSNDGPQETLGFLDTMKRGRHGSAVERR
jgi:hypothetical protein